MTEPTDAIWGQFAFLESGQTLLNVRSGQRIRRQTQRLNSDEVFQYGDSEIEFTFVVQRGSQGITVDFRRVGMADVTRQYGLWRRLASFLPDALLVWFYGGPDVQSSASADVTLIGGWQNGRWAPSLRFNAHASRAPYAESLDAFPGTGLTLCPLTARPATWRFVDAPHLQLDVALQTVPGESTPVLDRQESVEQQLAGAPRFVRDDGEAQLFHRYVDVNFWRNEDYDPKPVYGYANGQIAFTFTALRVVGCFLLRDPILMDHNADPRDFFERQVARGKIVEITPGFRLWDEFLFAVVDVCALTTGPSSVERPIITERNPENLDYYRARWPGEDKDWNGIVFGSHLQMVQGLPMRTPLGMAHTSFTHGSAI